VTHLSLLELEAGLPGIRLSPADVGRLDLIVYRPAVDKRRVVAEAALDLLAGLVGDTWPVRPSIRTSDRSPHPDMQLNVINSRVASLIAGSARPDGVDRRPLAGDQLYIDFDLSVANLPVGTRLQVGPTVIEVTDQSHLGCAKFSARFGPDAMRFVNSAEGRRLRLRGLNARVVSAGTVRLGDTVHKVGVAG
jgi:hypothetical protein